MLDIQDQINNLSLAGSISQNTNSMRHLMTEELGHVLTDSLVRTMSGLSKTGTPNSAIFSLTNGAYVIGSRTKKATHLTVMAGIMFRYLSGLRGIGALLEPILHQVIINPQILYFSLQHCCETDFQSLKFMERLKANDPEDIASIRGTIAATGALFLSLDADALTALADDAVGKLTDKSGVVHFNTELICQDVAAFDAAMQIGLEVSTCSKMSDAEALLVALTDVVPTEAWVSRVEPMSAADADTIVAMNGAEIDSYMAATKH